MTTESVTIVSPTTGADAPASQAATSAAPQRPEHVPEKFWDAEKGVVRSDDLAKSYAELEKKVGQKPDDKAQKAETKAGAKDDKAAKAEAPEPMQNLASDMKGKGLDFHEFFDEIQDKGELSEDSLGKLEAAGYSKAFLNEYIAGQEALAEKMISEVHGIFGGEKEFSAATQWAAANLPAAEVEEINAVIQRGNQAEIKRVFKALKSDIISKRGTEPNLLKGDVAGAGARYESWAQVTKDMRSPEYKRDPAFRASVQSKIAASKL